MLPSRRMIIAALIIILINFAMMIVLAQLHWFGRVIAVVGMIFIGLVIMVRKDAARAPIWFVVVAPSPSSCRICSSSREPATTRIATSGTAACCWQA
jgi:hypothetical protein